MKPQFSRYLAVMIMAFAAIVMTAIAFSGCQHTYEMPDPQPQPKPSSEPEENIGQDNEKPGEEGEEHQAMIEAVGDGSFDNPYNVAAVRELGEGESDIWVVGYIAGFIQGDDYTSGAAFRPVLDTDNYDGSNLIISDFNPIVESNMLTASGPGSVNCIPVRLNGVFKRLYGLREHPEYMAALIKINCATEEISGVRTLGGLTQLLIFQ